MKHLNTKSLVTAAVCLALCLVLPFLTGQIPQIGSALSPMHIPVLLAGFLCGPWWAMAVGAVAPLLRFFLFHKPPLYPTGLAMCFELAAYGLVSGLLYRALPKRVGNIYASLLAAMLAGLLLLLYMAMGITVWGEGLIDEGRIYYGARAIARDKEIAAEFAGPLTEDTVRAIWEKYGPPVNCAMRSTTMESLRAAAASGGNDNYCNRFVAEHFGTQVQGEDGRITYVLAEGWNESACLDGTYIFGYAGTGTYWDRFLMAYVLAHISIIVLLSPVFSEDYACRTADIILPTVNGRFTLWRRRMAVGCALASAAASSSSTSPATARRALGSAAGSPGCPCSSGRITCPWAQPSGSCICAAGSPLWQWRC